MIAQASAPLVALHLCPPSLAAPWPWPPPCSCTGSSPAYTTWPRFGVRRGRCEVKLKFAGGECVSPLCESVAAEGGARRIVFSCCMSAALSGSSIESCVCVDV